MEKVHSKFRIMLLVVGIVIFSLYSIFTLVGSKVEEDFISYHFLRKQVDFHRFGLSYSHELSNVVNEMDLAYYVFKASPVFNIYAYFDKEYRSHMVRIQNQWDIFMDSFDDSDAVLSLESKNALIKVTQDLRGLDPIMHSLNKTWNILYFTLLTITIIYFLFLLITLYFLTKHTVSIGGQGVDSVRNALIQGQEQERLRISLELHDKVAQDLFACRMIINDITDATKDESIISSFNKSISLLDSSIQEVRDLSYSLRPPALQAIGLDSAIQSYIDNFSKKIEIPITFKAIGISNKKIDETVSINLYRILQETLNNTVKHAHAERIDVKLLYTYPFLLLKIDDNGVGFRYVKTEMKAKGRNKLGLPGINERVSLLGGELIINTGKGEGTKILIRVPLEGNEKV